MTQFAIAQPIPTDAPRITVDAGLKPGRHRFGLVIVGSSGNTSASAEALVTVSATAGPTVPADRSTPPPHEESPS